MRDQKDFQEIENYGEEEEEQEQERGREGFGISAVPLAQLVLCALILLALAFCKLTDPQTYGKVAGWYQSEAAREIELPAFPSSEASSSPPAAPTTAGALQRV